MALFIKPGYWLAAPYKPKYWLNLDDLVSTVVTPLLNDNPVIEALTYPVENSYADNTALFADQGNQTVRYFQYVIGTDTYYEKLVTSTGAIVDYRELTADEVTTIILQGNSKRPVNKIYANAAAMYADQKKQITGFLYRTSDDDAHFEYLGTKNGNATDYKSVGSAPSLQDIHDGIFGTNNQANSLDVASPDGNSYLSQYFEDNGTGAIEIITADTLSNYGQLYVDRQYAALYGGVNAGKFGQVEVANADIILRQSGPTGGTTSTVVNFLAPTAITTLQFPAKTAGTYTIATLDDVSVPNLQAVTDIGSVTTNTITSAGLIGIDGDIYTDQTTGNNAGGGIFPGSNALSIYDNTRNIDIRNNVTQEISFGQGGGNSFSLVMPAVTGATFKTATFQDATGTVAYLSDISTPNLQAVTDVGNITTLNIAALSFNDLSLFAQIGVDIHNIGIGVEALANGNTGTNVVGIGFRALYGNSGGDQTAVGHLAMSNTSGGSGNTGIGYGTFQSNSGTASTALGKYAGRNNTGDSGTFIGYQAGNDNTGIYLTAVGHSAGDNNTAGQSTLIGYTAGFSNVGADSSLLGYGAGYANSGARATGIGEFALRNNSGADVTAIGYSAGFENQGLDVTAIGSQSLEFNPSDLVTAVGKNSGRYNAESSVVVIGDNAGVYNGGTNVVALGSNTISFTDDTGNAQNVANAGTDINTSTETITITAHGFGANGTYVNLKYSTTGTPIGGLVAGEVYQFLIVDANNIQSTANLSSVGTDTHTFTPQFVYDNITVLGANAEPTKSNQVTLGDSSVTEVYTDGHIKTHREVKDDTTTAYELVLADRNSVVTMNNAGANTLTIPANASVAFPIGTQIVLINKGAGVTTVAITTDTLNQNVGGLTLAQYDKRTLTKITATEWILGY